MDMGEAAIIVAPQQKAWMECDGQSDYLLGEELNEMEVVPSSHQVDQGSTEAVKKTSGKRSTSSKGTSRSRVPHCLPSKKAEFFRRGSPRKRNAISIDYIGLKMVTDNKPANRYVYYVQILPKK
ncbi:hypothetical protein Bca101_097545 [Brassica carinata]